MKICLLGEYSGNLDEAMRKISFHLAEELRKHHQVLTLDLRKVFTKDFWEDIKVFNPEIVHHIHGPTIRGLVLLKLISSYCHVKTVVSAMHWEFSFLSKRLIPMFKPDIILVQSRETEEMFREIGLKTYFLPSGVDINRFKPVTRETKERLREEFDIDKDKFIIPHVGCIKEGRNIQLLERLQKENNQVIIVGGGVDTGVEKKLAKQLEKSGCLVWIKYFKNIEEIYAFSDCYVFPTLPANRLYSIEMPLSVLEAMSCNLPVITTKFGALPRVFEEGDSLFFVEKEEDFLTALDKIKNGVIKIKTREKVLPYSWDNIVKKLEEIYFGLVGGENR